MALWMIRAGRHGEYEKTFLEEEKAYLGWGGIDEHLSVYTDKPALREFLKEKMAGESKEKISNALGQLWAFKERWMCPYSCGNSILT